MECFLDFAKKCIHMTKWIFLSHTLHTLTCVWLHHQSSRNSDLLNQINLKDIVEVSPTFCVEDQLKLLDFRYFVLIWYLSHRKQEILKQSCKLGFACTCMSTIYEELWITKYLFKRHIVIYIFQKQKLVLFFMQDLPFIILILKLHENIISNSGSKQHQFQSHLVDFRSSTSHHSYCPVVMNQFNGGYNLWHYKNDRFSFTQEINHLVIWAFSHHLCKQFHSICFWFHRSVTARKHTGSYLSHHLLGIRHIRHFVRKAK